MTTTATAQGERLGELATWSLAEASRVTRVPLRTLYRSVRDGDLKVIAPHGAKRGWRVLDAELRRWLGCS